MSHDPFTPTDAPSLTRVCRRFAREGATLVGWLARGISALAFWTAVVLPVLYPLLFVDGLHGREPVILGTLFVTNVVALVAGHDYARDSS